MIDIALQDPDWILIRQVLSLSLLKNRSVRIIGGGRFIRENIAYKPVIDDFINIFQKFKAGEIIIDEECITCNSQWPGFGIFNIESGKYSSITEIILLLLPLLLSYDFRSVLNIRGVTNSPLSYTGSFLSETFFSILEGAGLFAGYVLKRYGFYGSGGGEVEVRVYPAEPAVAENIFANDQLSISGARIIISGLSPAVAKRQRDLLSEKLHIDEKKICTIEVLDSDGMGNSVQIFIESGEKINLFPLRFVLYREMAAYNCAGDLIFDENENFKLLEELAKETDRLINRLSIPEYILREYLIYLFLTGNEVLFNTDTERLRATLSILRPFFQ